MKVSLGAAIIAGAFVVAISAAPAFAHHRANHSGGSGGGRPPAASVPEIDAMSGIAALSAVCAALALAWERRRHS
jgi:hypothetical protein